MNLFLSPFNPLLGTGGGSQSTELGKRKSRWDDDQSGAAAFAAAAAGRKS